MDDANKKINSLKIRILELKEEEIKISDCLTRAAGANRNPYFPTSQCVKMWEEYGPQWPDKKRNSIRKRWEDFTEIEGWTAFFAWLLEHKNRDIQWLELQLEKLQIEHKKSVQVLIKEFSEYFASLPNSKRPAKEIEKYLNLWEKHSGITHGRRSRAKEEAGLSHLIDGTVSNWENNWTEFRNSRSEK